MLYIINAIGPKIIFTFHCMHVVIMALAECALCFTNFKHQGTYGSCVALYGPTKNKQIVTSVRGIRSDAVKLCDLLAGVNIELPQTIAEDPFVRNVHVKWSTCTACLMKLKTRL